MMDCFKKKKKYEERTYTLIQIYDHISHNSRVEERIPEGLIYKCLNCGTLLKTSRLQFNYSNCVECRKVIN